MIYEFRNLFIKSSIWLWIFYILCKKRTVLELGVGDGLLLHFLSRNCWVFCFLPFYAQNGTANIGYSSREMQTLIFHQTESVQVLVCWKIYTLYGFSFYNPSYLILMLIFYILPVCLFLLQPSMNITLVMCSFSIWLSGWLSSSCPCLHVSYICLGEKHLI